MNLDTRNGFIQMALIGISPNKIVAIWTIVGNRTNNDTGKLRFVEELCCS